MKPPRLTGPTLLVARGAAETPGSDAIVRDVLRKSLGLNELAGLPEAYRGDLPVDAKPFCARPGKAPRTGTLPVPASRSWPRTSGALGDAYRAKSTTPARIAERALVELETFARARPTMNVLVGKNDEMTLGDANRSTERFQRGTPLGPLDGVPFLVKDEFDVAGFATSLGSRVDADTIATRDATPVARLRAAGAIFLGKTVLTEWGMSPIGGNVNQTMPHNAHDSTRAPGGSSTGSGVGVALGLAPIAAGGDGGGSIRIPASLNGVFGIKPTFGRVSRAGDGFKGSVAHAGPLGSSTLDLVRFLNVTASAADPDDDLTSWAPPPPEGGFGASIGAGVKGLRIGIDDDEWRDAHPDVASACRSALAALEKEGAILVSLKMPIARHAAKIGYMTIGPESLASHRHQWVKQRELITDDVRLAFAVLAGFSALEQLDAQRLRTGLRRELQEILRGVDVIALPTTAITAPRYTEKDAESSFSDPVALDGLCRYAFLGNLTGLPAATAPVGADASGLPIGLQILGDAWDEAGVLGVLAHLERIEAAVVRRPPRGVDLLGG